MLDLRSSWCAAIHFVGCQNKIHLSERQAAKSGYMAVGFVASTIASTPHVLTTLTLFGKELSYGLLTSYLHNSLS